MSDKLAFRLLHYGTNAGPRLIGDATSLLSAFLLAAVLVGLDAGTARPALAETSSMGSLVVKVTGLSNTTGQVRIAIFDSEQSWLDTAIYATILDVTGATCEWRIENVPHGDYAIAVFHDENGNGKNDRNFIGIPKEPYGFSNNARGRFGPASWKAARFRVAKSSEQVEIEVK